MTAIDRARIAGVMSGDCAGRGGSYSGSMAAVSRSMCARLGASIAVTRQAGPCGRSLGPCVGRDEGGDPYPEYAVGHNGCSGAIFRGATG